MRFIIFSLWFVLFHISASSQIPEIIIPDTIRTIAIPVNWKGYNLSAFTPEEMYNNRQFDSLFRLLRPGIIRWPSGNKSQNYIWQRYLSDTTHFHIHNLFDFSEQYGTSAQMVINFGNGNASDAAETVRFFNSSDAYYMHLRDSLLRHPQPLNIKYWEIGNESTTAWAFAWSWLGYAPEVRFNSNSGRQPVYYTHKYIDSLYYYGGSFYREGWVPVAGGMDIKDAILGDVKYYTANITTDTINVKFPALDTLDNLSVRVYLTPQFNIGWAQSLSTSNADVQRLYDSLTKPENLLSPADYHWNNRQVILYPSGGIHTGDAVLIEYNSVHHDGAFAFRDAMKNADPDIEVGYCVEPGDDLIAIPGFTDEFATHPPDFMIRHPYPTTETKTFAENGYFSETVFRAQVEVKKIVYKQNIWNQRQLAWNLTEPVGYGITEWNMALFDNAPDHHPFYGISGAMYVASFILNLYKESLRDSIRLHLNNHFGLLAGGKNFIHLFHYNADSTHYSFKPSPEGRAMLLTMDVLGDNIVENVTINNNPQVNVYSDLQGTQRYIDALEIMGGLDTSEQIFKLLIVNRDDHNDYNINLSFPTRFSIDSVQIIHLSGTMINDSIRLSTDSFNVTGSNLMISIPSFSINEIKIYGDRFVSVENFGSRKSFIQAYPNPFHEEIHIKSSALISQAHLLSHSGKEVWKTETPFYSVDINTFDFSSGIYWLLCETERGMYILKLMK